MIKQEMTFTHHTCAVNKLALLVINITQQVFGVEGYDCFSRNILHLSKFRRFEAITFFVKVPHANLEIPIY